MALISDSEFKLAKKNIEGASTATELRDAIESVSPHVATTVVMQRKFAAAIIGKPEYMFLVMRVSPLVDPVPVGGVPDSTDTLNDRNLYLSTAYLLAFYILSGGWSSAQHVNIMWECIYAIGNDNLEETLIKPYKDIFVHEDYNIPPTDPATLFDSNKSLADLLEETASLSPMHYVIHSIVERITGGVLDDSTNAETSDDGNNQSPVPPISEINNVRKVIDDASNVLIKTYATNARKADEDVRDMMASSPNYILIDTGLLDLVLRYTKSASTVQIVLGRGAVVTPKHVDILISRKKSLDAKTYDRIAWLIATAVLINKVTNSDLEATFSKVVNSVVDQREFEKLRFKYPLKRLGRFESHVYDGTIKDMITNTRHITDSTRRKLMDVFKSSTWAKDSSGKLFKGIVDEENTNTGVKHASVKKATDNFELKLADALQFNTTPRVKIQYDRLDEGGGDSVPDTTAAKKSYDRSPKNIPKKKPKKNSKKS